MWLSNSWNNFAPFAGFMLRGMRWEARWQTSMKRSTGRSSCEPGSERAHNARSSGSRREAMGT
jgi:hypothetical protein